jgi:hypothetical protein
MKINYANGGKRSLSVTIPSNLVIVYGFEKGMEIEWIEHEGHLFLIKKVEIENFSKLFQLSDPELFQAYQKGEIKATGFRSSELMARVLKYIEIGKPNGV